MPVSAIKDKQGNTTLDVRMAYGIKGINKGMPVRLTLLDDYFVIQQRFSHKASINLMRSQITKIEELCGRCFVVKNQGADGESPKEALLAVRDKHPGKVSKPNFKDYLVINYEAASKKVLVFETVAGTTIGLEAFIREVESRTNTTGASEPEA